MDLIVPPSVLNRSVASGLNWSSSQRNYLSSVCVDPMPLISLQTSSRATTTMKKMEQLAKAKSKASVIFYQFFVMYFLRKMPRLMLT